MDIRLSVPLGPVSKEQRYAKQQNVMLNLLVSAARMEFHANVVGAFDTHSFLTFFNQGANSVMHDGTPSLMAGDVVIVDNYPL